MLCSPVDGYPVPEIRWHLVKGPPNESRFYNISKDGKKLHIKSETPQNSDWIFNCTATNTLPSYSGIYNRTVAFSVSRTFLPFFCSFATSICRFVWSRAPQGSFPWRFWRNFRFGVWR